MPSLESPHAASDAEFRARLLRFVNEVLPRLDRQQRNWQPVESGTSLFTSGLLDSMSILHLLVAVEKLSGRRVPDKLVVMKHFQNVDAITATFGPTAEEVLS
jgi:acyl carrier protein